MKLEFYKYQGTGNDFIIIDNRQELFGKYDAKRIALLCDRRFGIGADGLILLENHDDADFSMIYFNSDGNQSSMCGNGGRCIVAFANYLGIIKSETTFMAVDGIHYSKIKNKTVSLQMQNVRHVEDSKTHCFLNTGSPHHIEFVQNLSQLDIKSAGSKIRYGNPYGKVGTNVNFVKKIASDNFAVRTYERGVEDETLSCGTGVTAVAIAMHYIGETEKNIVQVKTLGGELEVSFKKTDLGYENIKLIGPAELVFKGEI